MGLLRFLNKVILLLFASSMAAISLAIVHLTNWPIGYLMLGITIGFFADTIRQAVTGRALRFVNEQHYESVYRTAMPVVQPPQRNSHLPLHAEQALLAQTDNPVHYGTCSHCGFTHPLLNMYPYDPRLHYTECMIPELRSLVDQVLICPQELLDQCVENPTYY